MNRSSKDPRAAADLRRGLTEAEVEAARRTHGWNELPKAEGPSPIGLLTRQFASVLILILVVAALLAFALGETIDAAAILLVVALNASLGFVQDWRAERALAALRSMLTPTARVRRAGREAVIEMRELTPGDVVILDAGDRAPADMTVAEAAGLRLDESVLTGESVALDKGVGDQIFMGAAVVGGRGECVVDAIGLATKFGEIARLSSAVAPRPTTMQLVLGRLARRLGLAAIGVGALVGAVGVATGRELAEMTLISLSLGVAIVPEGLPAVVTITLALGAAAMARIGALARRLQAVETLGAASVICTDKTGTLTENKMTATEIWTPGGAYDVTGVGYDPAGHIEIGGRRVRAADDQALAAVLETASICNHARLERAGADWRMVGEPTEGALIVLAHKGWAPEPDRASVAAEAPFSSERKRMSVLATSEDGGFALHLKGAPETVFDLIEWGAAGTAAREVAEAAYGAMAAKGLRVLALARRAAAGQDDAAETGLVLIGLIGVIDPPRAEVKEAVAGARAAGVRVVMITGDSPITAAAIADQLGIAAEPLITGAELEALSDDALDDALRAGALFARTAPGHKLRIVEALQRSGLVVAMTGDGVNDAPALKQADIGVAMGVRGADVAKESADLVLLDDDFAAIVAAIREGRRQFDNVRKFVGYLLASNAGEVLAITVGLFLGWPLVFLASQILWMNLVTDGVTAVALGMEKSEPAQMSRPPRRKTAPVIDRGALLTILAFGGYTGLASLWIFQHFLPTGEDLARTAAFTAMVCFEKASVFAFRSLREPNWRIGWFSNPFLAVALAATLSLQALAVYWPPLQTLLRAEPLGIEHWMLIAVLAAPLILAPELFKSIRR